MNSLQTSKEWQRNKALLAQTKARRTKNSSRLESGSASWFKYVGHGDDGHYLVIFFLSITADLVGLAIGTFELGVSWIPWVGWLVDITLEKLEMFLSVGFATAIATIYFLAGHFKYHLKNETMEKELRWKKVASLVGFDLMEVLPTPLSVLPGFTAAFLINYLLILKERAALAKEKQTD